MDTKKLLNIKLEIQQIEKDLKEQGRIMNKASGQIRMLAQKRSIRLRELLDTIK